MSESYPSTGDASGTNQTTMLSNQTDIEAKIDTIDTNLDTLTQRATADAGSNTTGVVCAELAGYGDDYFNTGWWLYVILNENSHGAAPEGEWVDITDYTSSTGTFLTDTFTAAVETGDYLMLVKDEAIVKEWEHQAPATLNQVSPATATYYTVLDTTTAPTRAKMIAFCSEDNNEDLTCRITIDGEAYTDTWTATADSVYYVYAAPAVYATSTQLIPSTSVTVTSYNGFTCFEGKSMKVEIRKDTKTGDGDVNGVVWYELKKP
jgi:hypothetical protein